MGLGPAVGVGSGVRQWLLGRSHPMGLGVADSGDGGSAVEVLGGEGVSYGRVFQN